MTLYAQPDFENIWASEGGRQPPSLNQILSGWAQNQFPPSEVANHMQNRIEQAIAYIIQCGIPEWQPKMTYKASSLAVHGGVHYYSLKENVAKPPDTSPDDWRVAFDSYGANADLRAEVATILGQDGHLPFYVRKADPVMDAKAKAPAFEAAVGGGDANKGFRFTGFDTGVTSIGGNLVFRVKGSDVGKLTEIEPDIASNDNTLVTTAMLKKVLDEMEKKFQIPIGWSVVTKHSKPPSDAAQLGYGTWVLDCQGSAIVGVSKDTAASLPEWVRDADSTFGEYNHAMTIPELPRHRDTFPADDQLIAQFDLERNTELVGRRYDAHSDVSSSHASGWAYLPYVGESVPFNVVQPSQTKFIWTRIA